MSVHLRHVFYDVLVVGARCAGAATAMLLARAGLRVLAVERGCFGTDTLSTHALMRAGVLQLHRWNLLDAVRAAGTPPIRATSFHYGDEVVRVPIKPRDGVDALYAPRRTLLDALLVDAARAAGAEVLHEVRVTDLVRTSNGEVGGVVLEGPEPGFLRVTAGLVIGADGLRSSIARLTGAESYRHGRHASAVVYGYWEGLELEGSHWHYRPGVSAGVIPTNDGLTCVFAAMPSARFREEIRHDVAKGYRRVLRETIPEWPEEGGGVGLVSALHGFPGEVGFFRRSYGPGWALVGDAGLFRDPITAHGITDALRDAELLARAVIQGTRSALAEYQEQRDELALTLFKVTDDVASFDWDLETVQARHLVLSEEMNREVAAIRALEAGSGTGRAA